MPTRYFKFILIALSALILSVGCNRFNKLVKSSDYELKYKKALEYYEKHNYTNAIILLEELIPVFKGTERAEEVYYYYAYSHYYQEDYGLAGYHFRTFARNYPMSKHAEECAYMNAYCFYLNSPRYSLDQYDTKNAIIEFQNFLNAFPESKRVDTCNILIDKLRAKLERKNYEITKQYFHIEDWKASIVAAEGFIAEFPGSDKCEEMRAIIIKSYYNLAINSVESKKLERIDKCMENYLKFVDLHPSSRFIRELETIYINCQRIKSQQNQ